MRTIESIKSKEVVHCPTIKEAQKFCKLLHEAGRKWCNGSSYLEYDNWSYYQENTCYNPSKDEFSNKSWYEERNYTIIPCSEFFDNDESKLKWSWCSLDKPGIWAYGGNNKNSPIKKEVFSVININLNNFAWRCYLGPIPEIEQVRYKYKKYNGDLSVGQKFYILDENNNYVEKTLVRIFIDKDVIKLSFSDLCIYYPNNIYVRC